MMINFGYFTILFFSALGFPEAAYGDSSPVVSLEQGQLRGFEESSTEGGSFFSFLGIPYAEPPLGNLQFKDPVKHKGWDGERDATQRASSCSQTLLIPYLKDKTKQYLGAPNCLFVNVHSPKLNPSELPVMVFFHGGAFIGGSGNFYEPDELLSEEIVLVTVNYRLGIQGFLSTGDGVATGNFGLKDQILALRWVKENIHKFGGNPTRVTIFGESAGAASTHFHILSKESEGLFSRAILQSGSLLCPWAKTSDVRSTALRIGEHFNCFAGRTHLEKEAKSQQLLECLSKVNDRDLTLSLPDSLEWGWFPLLNTPHVDGDLIPQDPETLLRKATGKQVDTMLGTTRDEGAFVSNCFIAVEEQRKAIVDDFSSVGPLSLGLTRERGALDMSKKAYGRFVGGIKNKDEDLDNLNKMFGDRHFGVCTDWAAMFQAKTNRGSNKKVFYYELHHRGQRSLSDPFNITLGKHWVSHADELFYLFPMKKFGLSERSAEDKAVRDVLVKTWTNFAKFGNPTPDKTLGFIWEEFTEESPKHLKVQPKPEMEDDLRREVREFWSSLPTTQNKLLFGESANSYPKEEF